MRVNAAILDKLRVSILDEQGAPLPGRQSAIIRGNGVSLPVQWPKAADLSALADTPVMLRFELDDAEIFSFACR